MSEMRLGVPARGSDTGRPIMVLLDVLGRRGALRVLWEMRDGGASTFRTLQSACESNPGSLNTRLRELRELGIVDHDGSGYRLTEQGAGLVTAFGPLQSWANQWGHERR